MRIRAPRPTTDSHQPLRDGRTLHAVHADNLTGTASPTEEEVRAAWNAYRALIQPGDQVIVACSHHSAPAVWFAVGDQVQRLARSGPGGAGLALLDAVDLEYTAARFEWLVVASGDHIFAPLLHSARLAGLRTWRVTGAGRCSQALYREAQVHSRLRTIPVETASVALAA